MSRAISREQFDEKSNYIGVHMQRGRVVLDSDWNESQEITSALLKRISREAMGEGSPNNGFFIDRIFPIPLQELADQIETAMGEADSSDPVGSVEEALQRIFQQALGSCVAWLFGFIGAYFFGPLLFFIQFPGHLLDDAETLDGWELDPPEGNLRIGRDGPFAGRGFLRLSGHPGTVRLTKTVPDGGVLDLSAYQMMIFRFRMSRQAPGPIRFFLEDQSGGRTTWTYNNPALAREQWMAGFAAPLDVSFHIFTAPELPTAYRENSEGEDFEYATLIGAVGGVMPIEWEVSDGALPDGLELEDASSDADDDGPFQAMRAAAISGTPTETGTFTFTVTATDDEGEEASREFTLVVEEVSSSDFPNLPLPGPIDILQQVAEYEIGPGGPADPSETVRYGFELYQDPVDPILWEIDDLRLGSTALQEEMGENNFIIRGSELSQVSAQLALMGLLGEMRDDVDLDEDLDLDEDFDDLPASDQELDLLELLNADFQITQPGLEDAGRMYVNGLPVLQVQDTLYSMQADPNDPPITTPLPGSDPREDIVYLDVWEEPVTYVEDPDIREIALGGPDTSTRLRLRHCVRVAQGEPMPVGDGRGRGLLSTEGVYTGRDNRLYRIEIEEPGELGSATFRWSDENASVLGRVTRTIDAGSQVVLVEDASRFQARDHILIRSGLRQERARIASIVDDAVTLDDPVSASYEMADRPRIERWNAFGVSVPTDPDDPLVSTSISLRDGVRVRFAGRDLRRGDYWTFRTRYLAPDQSAGIDPHTRIEDLGFVRPHGVRHHYVPLSRITRRSGDQGRIHHLKELRPRIGTSTVTEVGLPPLTALSATDPDTPVIEHIGGTLLPPTSKESKFLIFVSGSLQVSVDPGPSPDPELSLLVAFYNHDKTDPATEPDVGRVQDRERRLPLERVIPGTEVPIQVVTVSSGTPFAFLPTDQYTPASVEVFAKIQGTGRTVELANLQLMAVELKKST